MKETRRKWLEERLRKQGFDQPSIKETLKNANISDPYDGKYIVWITEQMKNGRVRLPEDGEKVRDVLKKFHVKKRRKDWTHSKDINRFNWYELEIAVGIEVKSKREKLNEIKMKGVEKIVLDKEWEVLKFTSAEAVIIYARGTRWCITSKRWALNYLKEGPFYMFFNQGYKYALLHIPSNQFMDTNDRPVREVVPLEKLEEFLDRKEKIRLLVFQKQKERLRNEFIEELENDYTLLRTFLMMSPVGRIPELEETIAKNAMFSLMYANSILKDRFPRGENAIAETGNAHTCYSYVIDRGLTYEEVKGSNLEKTILCSAQFAIEYARTFRNEDIELNERVIATEPRIALEYAWLRKKRFHIGEKAISERPEKAFMYARFFNFRFIKAEIEFLRQVIEFFSLKHPCININAPAIFHIGEISVPLYIETVKRRIESIERAILIIEKGWDLSKPSVFTDRYINTLQKYVSTDVVNQAKEFLKGEIE